MDNVKVMIVEDNTTVAKDLSECIIDLDYEVTSIQASGEESIEQAELEQPDIVIMDINLRDEMDGVEAADQIHSKFGIPVVFLSAYSDKGLLKRAREVGSFGYLIKPFEEREIYATLEMALYKAKAEKECKSLVKELQKAAEHIEVLRGIIPICSSCKKIRDDEGYWHQVDVYFRDHSEIEFSHALCANCIKELYPTDAESILQSMKSKEKE